MLDTLIDPNIITLLLSIGTLGLIVEMWNPGSIFPGTVGAICLVLGLFGLSVLPVSAAGVLLMLLAALFFVLETFIPSHGALTAAGDPRLRARHAAALRPGGRRVPGLAAALDRDRRDDGALHGARRRQADPDPTQARGGRRAQPRRRARRRRGDGLVFVNGELWQAHRADGEALEPGDDVAVEGVVEDGLELIVTPASGSPRTRVHRIVP